MNIKFKRIEDVDYDKVFPVVDKVDYALLEGQSMSIDAKTYEKMVSTGFLNLAGYEISQQLIEVATSDGLSPMQHSIQQIVDDKFIYSEEVVDVLVAGIEATRNVLLWGRGGHGKSEITELVLNELHASGNLSSPPFIQAFGDGLTEEKLFGGMNINKYKEHGVIEYLPENSFMNHEIVVFEEIFDAPPSVLLSLKDIMTSKKFRQGNEIFDVKTKVFIGLTNKSKEEFADKDDSLKALAERFALTLKVEWKRYTKNDFVLLFKKIFGEAYFKTNSGKLMTLANICEMNNSEGGSFISPRTAVAAADLYVRGKKLEYISDIDRSIIAKYQSQIVEAERTAAQETLLQNLNDYITTHNLEFVDESEQFLKDLNEVEESITGQKIDFDDLDFGSQDDKQVKINKCKYLLSIIDRQQPAKSTLNSFTSLKKRVSGIVGNLSEGVASN